MNKSQIRSILAGLPGTDTQKVDSYLCAHRPGHSTLPWHQRAYEAVQFLKSLESQTSPDGGTLHLTAEEREAKDESFRKAWQKGKEGSAKEGDSRARISEKANDLMLAVKSGDVEQIAERIEELQAIIDESKVQLGSAEKAQAAIKACAGRNDIEKAINYLLTYRPEFERTPWAAKVGIASQFLRTGNYEVRS